MRFKVVGIVTKTRMTVAIEGSSKATVSVDDVYREGSTFSIFNIICSFS